ncbi:membrane-spanning 4-domains subfamily A member 6E-like isoform X4 [Ursus arctos]|uniref:membrane-spanning 4-domains subfamily A member 6E-like isoform X4 n=1 Tax=Ursus arctos TaxID=9644 RepID=UPI00201824FE|nr:membrane-spanning 4-domains subfamily A member 6E-like isoform X4 [Ursus arctos]XP_057166797.1 membrane-spanning 4-domains subfamily A member 6E-like isoform X4 [Ursus arctos]
MGKYWLPVWGALRALHFLRAEFIFSSSVGGTIISQPMANQTIVVLTPNGINFPQTETPKPTNQTQDSLEKRLKAEIKVLGAQIGVAANILSSLCALVGFILLSVNLAALDPAFWKCDLNKEDKVPLQHFYIPYMHPYVKEDCFIAKTTLAGTLSVMLICTVLEFCLALLAAAVWWKEAQSNFAGSVLFLPQSYKNKSTIPAKAFSDPGYEELLPS